MSISQTVTGYEYSVLLHPHRSPQNTESLEPRLIRHVWVPEFGLVFAEPKHLRYQWDTAPVPDDSTPQKAISLSRAFVLKLMQAPADYQASDHAALLSTLELNKIFWSQSRTQLPVILKPTPIMPPTLDIKALEAEALY